MLWNSVLVLAGLVLLTLGGEALIRGALGAARKLGVSPLLSGLVIVGFGTSAPELVVSVNAALSNQANIAIGNVVGSNIANVLLILGICSLITPMQVKPLALKRDAVTVLAASIAFVLLTIDGNLSSLDALLLLAALVFYLTWAYRSESNHSSAAAEMHLAAANEVAVVPTPVYLTIVLSVGGLLLLIAGSQLFVTGAVRVASALGISDTVIGLTLVALGTSLPELTISVIAALRKHADVAIGNILGSNIFNLLGILGVAGLVRPLPISVQILHIDQWVMLATAALILLFLYTGRRLSRAEGAVLLACYGAYLMTMVWLH